ncbi:hypothetical protein BO70DRAFT_365908 [Aspergillus heteromorphus CBS 117.55]|uniref:Uncharacterized protein n=1 Tax=Aspergillus heteromorphus CBS 117.55 TaxID=1448321 RepID=A0A317V7Z0_9EURO|nr:uncharacterized protein BO70DRAFT_365908 [Aspergillus heteromorphus CBS 117.55]PWY69097.1 hypothetical protein BO70DRAFT_365908 [Aspergillus heteromorphus CBS 117.55]
MAGTSPSRPLAEKSPLSGKLNQVFRFAAQRGAAEKTEPPQARTSVYEQTARDAYDASFDVLMIIIGNAIFLAFFDFQYGTHFSWEMGDIMEDLVYVLLDSIELAKKTSAEANGFRDAHLRMMADSTLSIADREAWINSQMQMAVSQAESARVITQRHRAILTEFLDLWFRVFHVVEQRVAQVTDTASPDALLKELEALCGMSAMDAIGALLKPVEGVCMIERSAVPEKSAYYSVRQTPQAFDAVFVDISDKIEIMDRVWAITRFEAIKIQSYLDAALALTFHPPLMNTSLQNAADSYAEIAAYLIPYAREIQALIHDIWGEDFEF